MNELTVPETPQSKLRMTGEAILERNGRSPAKAQAEFVRQLWTDPQLLLALFKITPELIQREAFQYLRQLEAKNPRPRQPVKAHTRKPAGQLSPETIAAKLETTKHVARKVLMVIDGVDIRDWTVGQCRTAGRHKAHEAYVLRVLGNVWEQQPHSKTIGELMADEAIANIVEQGREHARDL